MRLLLIVAILSLAMLSASRADAQVYITRTQAAEIAFPDADRVEDKTIVLDDDQRKRIEELAKSHFATDKVKALIGWKDGHPIGYGFIDSDVVRTMPATFLVVVSAQGAIRDIRTMSFYEPEEFKPHETWLNQFKARELAPTLSLRGDINAIAGATLSSQAVTAAVRRSLALYQVLFRAKE